VRCCPSKIRRGKSLGGRAWKLGILNGTAELGKKEGLDSAIL